MAKDPAFLFYSNDFLSGTFTMTDEQVGKYIRLLCLQHQKKHLTEKDMINICKSYDEDIYSKFIKENDTYYNVRLKDEANKRSAYSESRKNNRKKKDMINISNSYEKHMENEIENKNKNIINNKGNKYKKEDFGELPINNVETIQRFIKVTKNFNIKKDKIDELWQVFKDQILNGENWYASESKVYNHFLNWIKTQKFENNDKRTNQEKQIDAMRDFINRA